MTFDQLVARKTHPQFYFVQIGANDGVTDDTLRPHVLRHRWRGVLVEPLPDVFEKLKANYGGVGGLTFVNAAVVDGIHRGRRVAFYRHPRHSVCSGLAPVTTMQRAVRMEETRVAAVTMDELLDGMRTLDLLQIDVEGFDAHLIEMIPFDRISPAIIRFEHKHIWNGRRRQVEQLLRGHGYEFFCEGFDTVAYMPVATASPHTSSAPAARA